MKLSRSRGSWRFVVAGVALIVLVLLAVAALRPKGAIPSSEEPPRRPTKTNAHFTPIGPAGEAASSFPKPDRPVASVVSDEWATEDLRDDDGEAKEMMDFLGIGPGSNVADIGAGRGYYTVRLAKRVGPGGRVFAVDIVPSYLDALQKRVRAEGLSNVTIALGEPHDPRLPPRSIDVALIVHTYHEVEQPFGLLYNMIPALKPGGRVVVIDLDQPTNKHGTPQRLLLCEAHALGFKQAEYGWLRGDVEYVSVLTPPAERPGPSTIKTCRA